MSRVGYLSLWFGWSTGAYRVSGPCNPHYQEESTSGVWDRPSPLLTKKNKKRVTHKNMLIVLIFCDPQSNSFMIELECM